MSAFRAKKAPLVNLHVVRLLGRDHTVNCDKAKEILDWKPRMSLDDALKETAKWFIDSGIYDTL